MKPGRTYKRVISIYSTRAEARLRVKSLQAKNPSANYDVGETQRERPPIDTAYPFVVVER